MQALGHIVKAMEHATAAILIPKVPGIVNGYLSLHRMDAYDDDIAKAMADWRGRFYGQFTDEQIAYIAADVAKHVDSFNANQEDRFLGSAFGLKDFKTQENWAPKVKTAWVNRNVELIKTIPERYLGEVNSILWADIKKGKDNASISADIQKQFEDRLEVSASRADLIARDQVSKLNGELTKFRQTSLGVASYVWQTVGDNRVRDTHAEREGVKFSWAEPPEGGHPGEDYQCRCNAIADLESIGDNAESEGE
jgi:SPP1 gp7 family putative phage head morphogenesis protein